MTTETRFAIQNKNTKSFLRFGSNFSSFSGADMEAYLVERIKDATMYRGKNFLLDDLELVFHQLKDLGIEEKDLQLVAIEISYEIKECIPLNQPYYNDNQ